MVSPPGRIRRGCNRQARVWLVECRVAAKVSCFIRRGSATCPPPETRWLYSVQTV